MKDITIRLVGLSIEKPDPDKSYCVAFTTDEDDGIHLAHGLKFKDEINGQVFYGVNYLIFLHRVVWWVPQSEVDEAIIKTIMPE